MSVNPVNFSAFTGFGSASPASTSASPSATVTRPTDGSGGTVSINKEGTTGSFGLSTDDFLKLFLAQLQNQDPTQPMDDSQMLSQLSQMSSIQTMQGIQTALEGSQLAEASNLIGKNVTGLDVDGKSVDGVVTAVTQSNDAGLVLQVGTQYIKPDSVVNVTPAPTTTSS
jgi:flagellar basal-body rod modification protein FlgD